jgi:hypothetical protein
VTGQFARNRVDRYVDSQRKEAEMLMTYSAKFDPEQVNVKDIKTALVGVGIAPEDMKLSMNREAPIKQAKHRTKKGEATAA